MLPPESFGGWIKRRRRSLDLTQRALAGLVGCAAITIRKIEADQLRPSRQVAGRLFDALQLQPAERAAFAAAARGQQLEQTALPTLLAPLIGREQSTAAACELLARDDVRLVTLYGPPGIGKTSLALHVAGALLPHFADGAVWIPLAEVDEPASLVEVIGAALGVHAAGDSPVRQRLSTALVDKHMLLVLDNFEQLLGAAPELAALLAGAPGVKLLVTSRTVLRIAGEHPLLLPPLALPAPAVHATHADLAGSAAVQLFVQRARAAEPGFLLSGANAPAIAAICARMDGLPLAIELAAARIRLWTPEELLAQLDGPLPAALHILTGGRRDQPPRQQTLRDAIAWSYRLLNRDEQLVFRRLGMFAGGFTLDAAEQLMAGDVPAPGDVLQSLLDNSLVQRLPAGDGSARKRFGMLETLRVFALEQLEASAECGAVGERHARYMLQLGHAAGAACYGGDWLQRLEAEHANLCSALEWFCRFDAEDGLRLACALEPYWFARGYAREGRQWLRRLLEDANGTDLLLRARALSNAGYLAWFQSDRSEAGRYFADSHRQFAALGSREGQAWTLLGLARVARFGGYYAAAEGYCSAADELFESCGDRAGRGWIANERGQLALMQKANGRAVEQFILSRTLFAGTEQLDGNADALWGLGSAELARERYSEADAAYAQSLVLWRSIGEKLGSAGALAGLGSVALATRRYRQARTLLSESLALHWELGNTWGLLQDLVALAAVEAQQRLGAEHPTLRFERALRIVGAATALHQSGVPLWPVYEALLRSVHADALTRLSSAGAAAALAEGVRAQLGELVIALTKP